MSASTRGCGRMWAALSTLVSHSAALLALCSHRSRSFGSPVMAERGRISLGRPPSSAPNAARTSASPSPLPVPAAPAAVPLAITPGAAVPPHQTRAKVCRGLRCRRQSSRRVRAARAAGVVAHPQRASKQARARPALRTARPEPAAAATARRALLPSADECACRSGSDADAPIGKRDGRGDEEEAFERELDALTRAEAERM